ncbi:MAG: protein phosphatase 2C domain-containing protein [Bacillota bacterium]|nr:protein phosphatase 2C domain-containing protein [Bacillota bacterium]
MRVISGTDIGNDRKINQDYFISDVKNGVFIVADGIGGYANGEIASSYASERLQRRLKLLKYADFNQDIIQIIYQVNGELVEYCNHSFGGERMGTTILALKFFEEGIGFVSVGDTNLYGISGDVIEQINRSHVFDDKDMPTAISSAIGPGCLYKIDSGMLDYDYDYLVLCTDGLNKFVDGKTMTDIIKNNRFDDVAKALIREALSTDGGDNITVIVIDLGR